MDLLNHNFDDNRGNRTRKIKGNPNLDPDKLIITYLNLEGDKTLNEILIHVNKSGLPYSKQGLIKKLKVMSSKSKKLIRKIPKKETGSYPKYRTVDSTIFKIQSDSYAFKDHVCFNTLNMQLSSDEMNKMKTHSNNTQKRIIINMIFNFGIISFYTLLASYRRGLDPKKSKGENKKLHELWLKNAMSFEHNIPSAKFSKELESKLMRKIISKNMEEIMNKESEQAEEYQNYSSKKVQQEDFIIEAKRLEKTFSIMFPDWYDRFQNCENMINKENNKFMRDVCFERPEILLS